VLARAAIGKEGVIRRELQAARLGPRWHPRNRPGRAGARWRWKPSCDPREHAEQRARQRVVPRQQTAKTTRKTRHPLAHGHPRQPEDRVDDLL